MGWWDKPAIVVANKQKLPLGRAKYTSTRTQYGRSQWQWRRCGIIGGRGEMTGAALTGRLGIIPTLGRIIRVYDPSEEDSSTKQGGALHSGEKASEQCGRQWSWRQSTNHTHRPQPAISGQCKSSKSGSRRGPRVRNLSLDLSGP